MLNSELSIKIWNLYDLRYTCILYLKMNIKNHYG